MGADAFGLNCSVGPKDMIGPFKRLRKYARVPLVAKPNAGKPEFVGDRAVYNCTPDEYAECIPEYAENGVGLFGGCCGTTPEHIRRLILYAPILFGLAGLGTAATAVVVVVRRRSA